MPNTFTFSPHYGSRAGIEGWFGTGNLAAWADLNANGSATEITAQIERGLTFADAVTNAIAQRLGLTTPLTSASIGADNYLLLVELNDKLAGGWVYRRRGQEDVGNRPAGKMQEDWDEVYGTQAGQWMDGEIYRLLETAADAQSTAAEIVAPADASPTNTCCARLGWNYLGCGPWGM